MAHHADGRGGHCRGRGAPCIHVHCEHLWRVLRRRNIAGAHLSCVTLICGPDSVATRYAHLMIGSALLSFGRVLSAQMRSRLRWYPGDRSPDLHNDGNTGSRRCLLDASSTISSRYHPSLKIMEARNQGCSRAWQWSSISPCPIFADDARKVIGGWYSGNCTNPHSNISGNSMIGTPSGRQWVVLYILTPHLLALFLNTRSSDLLKRKARNEIHDAVNNNAIHHGGPGGNAYERQRVAAELPSLVCDSYNLVVG